MVKSNNGDFNCVMNQEERIGATVRAQEYARLQSYMIECGMSDMCNTGSFSLGIINKVVRIEFFANWIELW